MSNILNIKNLDGDWDSIVAIRGKQGDKGEDGTKFEVNARFVPGNNVVPIADFITDKGTTKETTHTIYAPKGEGGGTTVEYTDLHTFTDTMTVGEISVDGEHSEVVIPANVSEFANDAGYLTRSALPTKVSELENDAEFVKAEDIPTVPTKVSELENDAGYVGNDSLEGILDNVADISNVERYVSHSYQFGDFCTEICEDSNGSKYVAFCCALDTFSYHRPTDEDFNDYTEQSTLILADHPIVGGTPQTPTPQPLVLPSHSVTTINTTSSLISITISQTDNILMHRDSRLITLVNHNDFDEMVVFYVSSPTGNGIVANIRHYQNVSYWMPVPYCIAKPKVSGGGSNISVGHAFKVGSTTVAANAYEEKSYSITLPEGAIPISVVPYQEGTLTEVWAREQYTYENNVLTQKLWVHNKSSSGGTCHPGINVWYLMGASYYDAGATQGEE